MEAKKKAQPKKQGKGKKTSAIAKMAMNARMNAEQEEEERLKEENELKQKEDEEEAKRLEEERIKKEEAEKRKKERKDKKNELKKLGLYRTPLQLENDRKNEEARKQFLELGLVQTAPGPKPAGLPDGKNRKKREPQQVKPKPIEEMKMEETEKNDEDSGDDWENLVSEKLPKRKKSKAKETAKLAAESRSEDGKSAQFPEAQQATAGRRGKNSEDTRIRYKAPIICVLGHVDTGKTKLLDKIRHTNVQIGEAGGITQQIGATMFPAEAIESLTCKLPNMNINIEVPGLLIIDTPGHESFSNLRSRGSSLCNLGILVVDIMHGLENQTIESLQMLKKRNIPFIVALNKVDRMYNWVPCKDEAFLTSFNRQKDYVQEEFLRRAKETVLIFAEQGYNAALYYENPDPDDYINLVPTSAITGEGIPDMLGMLVHIAQTKLQRMIIYQPILQATVMEVKVIEGLGTTIDVILANGVIKEDDTIVVAGFNGPIVTNIRALLTPQPMKEMRVKGEYQHHKTMRATMGIKISAQGLDHAMSGSQLFVAKNDEEIPRLEEEVQKDISQIFNSINSKGKGVHVQASTVGSLEALLEFLKETKIPVSSISIGPVFKKDVIKAQSQIEKGNKKQYASVLAFDVKIIQEAQDYAEANGVRIFSADIIYHLFDQFTKYVEDIKKQEKMAEGKGQDAYFPCVLKIVEVFRTSGPIVLGVDVLGGVLRKGTPLCIPDKECVIIGKVDSIEFNHKPLESHRQGQGSVAIKIKAMNSEQDSYAVGRTFEETNQVASWLTRSSIDLLKEYFMDEMTIDDWKLVKMLKTTYAII